MRTECEMKRKEMRAHCLGGFEGVSSSGKLAHMRMRFRGTVVSSCSIAAGPPRAPTVLSSVGGVRAGETTLEPAAVEGGDVSWTRGG